MSTKKVLLVAGALVAAGTVATLAAAPHFRGHRMGMGFGFDGGDGPRGGRLAEQLKEMDTNKDGIITLEEFLGRTGDRFARLDKNGDGVVDASDITASMKEEGEYRAKRFLKVFDADRDGKVTKEEFGQRSKDRFAMRDLNGDGVIDGEDLPPGMRGRAGRWAERAKDGKEGAEGKEPRRFSLDRLLGRADRRFAGLDKNSDGVIDVKDFEAVSAESVDFGTKRFLMRFDANGDGKVSKDEFERFAKERFAALDLDDDGKITEADLPPRMRGRGVLK